MHKWNVRISSSGVSLEEAFRVAQLFVLRRRFTRSARVRDEEPSSLVSSTMAPADVTCGNESEVVSAFALPRFRFVVGVGSGVSSGVRSPVPLIGINFSAP